MYCITYTVYTYVLYNLYCVQLCTVKPQLCTPKVVMQGKVFQMCTHLLYFSVLSLGGNLNTRRMSKPDRGSIFHIKKSMKYSGHMQLLCELSKLSNLMLLTSSDTKQTLMHLFLFTNSAQWELVSICTQSIRNCNQLSLHYILVVLYMLQCYSK